MQHIREMAVAGTFYPASCIRLKKMIRRFNHAFDTHAIPEKISVIIPRAVIVPHAGYIYSGFTANFAYRFLAHANPKRIIVIGPSHKVYFKGISGSFFESFQTPCKDITIDSAYLFALAKRFNIGFVPEVHTKEHSTEVQMPFIAHYFPKTPVIELVYGDLQVKSLSDLMVALLENPDNLLVVSSDLSHYYPQKQANQIDKQCLIGVRDLNYNMLSKCEACGLTSIKAVVWAAKILHLHSTLLDYRTSADYSHNQHSVVGYMSAMFY